MTFPSRSSRRLLLTAAFPFVFVAVCYDIIHAFPYGLLYDDGYFYAQIAYNIGTLGRSTFDGIDTTSGYHLLWGATLGFVSAAVGLFTADKAVHLYFFQVVFAGAATFMARAYAHRAIDRFVLFMLALFCTLLMETLLLSCLLLAFAHVAITRPAGEKRPLLSCAVAALVPLVRIDATVIVVVYCALLLVERATREALRLGTAVALGAMAQLGLMLWIFGQPFSVSAMIKVGGAGLSPRYLLANLLGPGQVVVGYLTRSALFFGMLGAVLFLASKAVAEPKRRRYLYLVAGVAAFVLIHFASHRMPFWCYLPGYVIFFYVMINLDLQRKRLERGKRAVSALLAFVMLAFIGHKLILHYRNLEISHAARDFALRIGDHVPPSGRIYQIDGSGYTGYFSGRAVVNGDGLVNSYAYARRLRETGLAGFLDDKGICYIITNVDVGDGEIVNYAGLIVRPEDVETLARSAAYGKFPTTDFELYRRRATSCRGRNWGNDAPGGLLRPDSWSAPPAGGSSGEITTSRSDRTQREPAR